MNALSFSVARPCPSLSRPAGHQIRNGLPAMVMVKALAGFYLPQQFRSFVFASYEPISIFMIFLGNVNLCRLEYRPVY